MKSVSNIVGILLIIFGILTLSYEGFHYTKRERIAQLGDIKISAETEREIHFPPILGAICLVGGIALVALGRIK